MILSPNALDACFFASVVSIQTGIAFLLPSVAVNPAEISFKYLYPEWFLREYSQSSTCFVHNDPSLTMLWTPLEGQVTYPAMQDGRATYQLWHIKFDERCVFILVVLFICNAYRHNINIVTDYNFKVSLSCLRISRPPYMIRTI